MCKLVVRREKEYENITKPGKQKVEGSTIGYAEFYDNEGKRVWTCVTLENAGPSTDTPGQDKRIVARSYVCKYSATSVTLPKNAKGLGILLCRTDDNGAFEKRRILVHIGNYPQDTEGCLLLGSSTTGKGTINESTRACEKFYSLVEQYGIENLTIELHEIS